MKKALAPLATCSLIVFACGVALSYAQQGAAGTNPQDYLNRAADAILALKSAQFTLRREGSPAVLDERAGLLFSAADWPYAAPDRVSCNVRVALKNGSVLQITRVWVPEGAFQSNPLTKQFAQLPPDPNFSIGAIFARTGIPEILRTGVAKPQLVNKAERLGSRETVHIRGDVSGKGLAPLMGSTVKPDLTYPVDLWMEERSANVVQLHVTEPDNNGWLIELFAPNEPVSIPTPQVPAATTPPARRLMARAHQYPGLILALVSLPVFIGALDLTIVSAVLPEVIRSMAVEIQELDIAGWVVTGYFVSYAVSMTFMGKVSDIAGRRIVYLVCLVIFFIGSWLVAASPGWPAELTDTVMRWFQGDRPPSPFAPLYALIGGRVVQAFGAGAMVPVSMALVADLYPPEKRALPLGIVGAVDTAGWVLGHLYGGVMVQFMSWPYLFWINLPIIAVMFAVTWWGLAGLPRTDVKGSIDWIGVALLGTALTLLNVGLGSPEADLDGSGAAADPGRLYWVIGAALTFAIFLFSQRKVRDPILNLQIFSNRNLSAASAINLLVGFCIMVGLVSVPIFINVAGSATDTMKAALVTGYLLCAFTVPMAVAAIPGGWLSGRLGYRWTVALGLVTAIIGFWLMTGWTSEMAAQSVAFFDNLSAPPRDAALGTGFMAVGLALAGIGIGLTIAPIGTAVINGVLEHERGMASSLVIILRLIGMSISMSSMTAYGLRRTTLLSRTLLRPEDALDFDKTAEVSLEVVTRVTGEMALVALAVAAAALAVAFLLRRDDSALPA